MNFFRASLIPLVALLLSACSLNPVQTSESAENWSFSGKMAVRNATEASSFNVEWLQTGQQYTIELSGPLGQGAMTVQGQPGHVTLQQGDDIWKSDNLNNLVFDVTRIDLPLEHLRFWVRALPAPGSPYELQRNDADLIESIEQSGWRVSISDYFVVEAGSQPRKLSFARAENSGKLIIRQWSIASPSQ